MSFDLEMGGGGGPIPVPDKGEVIKSLNSALFFSMDHPYQYQYWKTISIWAKNIPDNDHNRRGWPWLWKKIKLIQIQIKLER